MRPLTPYDTGEAAQPHLHDTGNAIPAENWGKVDFDDDESSTVVTVQVTRNALGHYVLHAWPTDDILIQIHKD